MLAIGGAGGGGGHYTSKMHFFVCTIMGGLDGENLRCGF